VICGVVVEPTRWAYTAFMLHMVIPRSKIHWAVAISIAAIGAVLGFIAGPGTKAGAEGLALGCGLIGFSVGSFPYELHLQDRERAARGETFDWLREVAAVLGFVGIALVIPNDLLPLGKLAGADALPLGGMCLVAAAGLGVVWLRRKRAHDADAAAQRLVARRVEVVWQAESGGLGRGRGCGGATPASLVNGRLTSPVRIVGYAVVMSCRSARR
jgi:hypothetical protein